MRTGLRRILIINMLLPVFVTGFCISDQLQVSILTLEPGSESYTIFGHTAIRIMDTTSHTDRIYNFGTFNFSTPHFYWKFLKGDLNYYLSRSRYKTYMVSSKHDQRKVWEQILDMEAGEKQEICHNLERCYNSEERFYRYDFFHDNCATRVRDAIFNAMKKTAAYDTGKYCCKTFRQLLDPFFSVNYWYDLGINLVIGREGDREAKSYDFMFLPVYIMEILEDAQKVSGKQLILDASVPGPDRNKFSYILPWIIVAFLILLSVPVRSRTVVFYFVVSAVGIMGLFLLFVSLISVNSGFRNNYNVVWMIPSLLIIFIKNQKINDILKIVYASLLVLMMFFRNNLPQELPLTFLPWVLILVFVLIMDVQWDKMKKAP
jgi:hypothetical protein